MSAADAADTVHAGPTLIIHDGGLPSLLALAMAADASEELSDAVIAWVPGKGSPAWADADAAVGHEQAEILAGTAARSLGVRLIRGPAWTDEAAGRRPTPAGLGISMELIRVMLEGVGLGAARIVWPVCPIARASGGGSALARMFALGERARLIEALASLDATAEALGVSAAGSGLAVAPSKKQAIAEPPALETPFIDLGWRDLIEQARRLNLPLDLCWGLSELIASEG